MFKEGQRILERQRFQFPSSWVHSDNIEGVWCAFNYILRRTCAKVEEKSNTALRVAGMRRDIQNCVAEVTTNKACFNLALFHVN